MPNDAERAGPLFLQLVLSLQTGAWYQLGKVVSPISGRLERDLEQGRLSIDLLIMLQEKTAGNLSAEEKEILDSAVYNLQMNYLDELNRDKSQGTASPAPPKSDDTSTADPQPPPAQAQ